MLANITLSLCEWGWDLKTQTERVRERDTHREGQRNWSVMVKSKAFLLCSMRWKLLNLKRIISYISNSTLPCHTNKNYHLCHITQIRTIISATSHKLTTMTYIISHNSEICDLCHRTGTKTWIMFAHDVADPSHRGRQPNCFTDKPGCSMCSQGERPVVSWRASLPIRFTPRKSATGTQSFTANRDKSLQL